MTGAGEGGRLPPVRQPRGPWVMTASGRPVEFLAPDPEMIALSDIAEQLAKHPRFVGATPGVFYSVAQHSVLVADLLPMDSGDGHRPGLLKIAGLLHDAHEYVTGDLPTPLKKALEGLLPPDPLPVIQERLDIAVRAAFGPWSDWLLPEGWADRIKAADLTALATERRDLMPVPAAGCPDWDVALPPPAPVTVRPFDWRLARALFLARARELAGIAGLSGGAWDR